MKKFSFILICISLISSAFAQGDIKGSILIEGSAAAENTVSLINTEDSSLVKIQVTDLDGSFSFSEIPAGNYFTESTGSVINDVISPAFHFDGTTLILDPVSATSRSRMMEGVIVQSRRPLVEMKADRILVNVEASPTNAGLNALDVIQKSPGITVDKDGNISLKGKQGVVVLIDGKPTQLSGEDLAGMLRAMNASELEQLEIMSNPPAKYDAAGNSGVINIRTKKFRTRGINGNVSTSYSQGVYAKSNTTVNLNFRKNKFNLFGSLGNNIGGGYQEFKVSRVIWDNNGMPVTLFNQHGFMPDTRNTYRAKLGLDYDFSKNTALFVSLNAMTTKMTYENSMISTISDLYGNTQSTNAGKTIMNPKVKNLNSNIAVVHKFDSAGTEITIEGSYVKYADVHRQQFYNSLYDANGTLKGNPDTLYGDLPKDFNVYAAKADFTKPLSRNRVLEAGGKVSYVSSDNNLRFDSIKGGHPVVDVNRTNHFIYNESIYATYATLSTPLSEKWQLKTGLRYEFTKGEGYSKTIDQSFKTKYGKLFPTLYVSYNPNDKHQLVLNYGRRVTRPQYRDMNPFVYIIDKYTFLKGNPELNPQYAHNIELTYMYKKFLTTSVNYSQTDGLINDAIETDPATNEVSMIKRNIARRQQVGFAVNFSKPVNKWMTINANTFTAYNKFSGRTIDPSLNVSGVNTNLFTSLQFKFKKGWDAEVNGWYNTRTVDGIGTDAPMGSFGLAASKTVLKNGKVTLNLQDPLALTSYTGTTKTGNVDAMINSRWDNRTFSLTFNYRFGKQISSKKRTQGSATEEQGRIGS